MSFFELPVLFGKKAGQKHAPALAPEQQLIADQLHGKHYNDALRGRVFMQSCTPLGLAIPIYTATAIAGGMPIWNPPNSGVNVELIGVSCGRASGTSDFGAIGLMARELDAIATGAIMTALAETTPFNAMLFAGVQSRVRSSNAGTCTVTAGVAGDWALTLFTHGVEADATASPIRLAYYDFNGSVIVPPGTLVYLADTKATTALYASTVIWKEIPIE